MASSAAPEVGELEIIKKRYTRYLLVSLLLTALALVLTFLALRIRSVWLMMLAFSILLAGFGLMFSGLSLRAEHRVMKEGGWK